jgi:hypothetical protein
MKKLSNYIRFITKDRKFIFFGFLIFVAIFWLVKSTNASLPKGVQATFWQDLTWWSKWLDPLLGTAVFLLTLVIGWTQLREDWKENLEKRLTVIFKFGERELMVCKKAYLSAEGDIRSLGQQIGSQMADNTRDLKFKANDIESKKLGVERNQFKNGEYFMHYQVIFELTTLPNPQFEKANFIWHEPDNTSVLQSEEWLPIVVEKAGNSEAI